MNLDLRQILLVEDSEDDAFFFRYALEKAGIAHSLQVVTDGQQTIDYLSGTGKYGDRNLFPLPGVIFLDLKLPCLSGFEVLAWMRNQAEHRDRPVFILSGSSEERDQKRGRELGANGYLVKPPTKEMLLKVMEALAGRLEKAANSV